MDETTILRLLTVLINRRYVSLIWEKPLYIVYWIICKSVWQYLGNIYIHFAPPIGRICCDFLTDLVKLKVPLPNFQWWDIILLGRRKHFTSSPGYNMHLFARLQRLQVEIIGWQLQLQLLSKYQKMLISAISFLNGLYHTSYKDILNAFPISYFKTSNFIGTACLKSQSHCTVTCQAS